MADKSYQAERKPEYKHEFVALMFAVAMAEIGLQAATIVKREDYWHDASGITHLILAFALVATSWVGWCKTLSPGGRDDVRQVFEREFLILMLDVLLVIAYLILIRTGGVIEANQTELPLAKNDGFWIAAIFLGYVVWDVLTKFLRKKAVQFLKWSYFLRFAVTLICLFISIAVWLLTRKVDNAHVIPAHLAMLSTVLLFRAGKDWVSIHYPLQKLENRSRSEIQKEKCWSWFWLITLTISFLGCLLWATALPLPQSLQDAMARPYQPSSSERSESSLSPLSWSETTYSESIRG